MSSAYLNSIRKKLIYDKSQSPVLNLESFYEGVKMLRYEWAEIKVEDKSQYYLDSPWGKELSLREIALKFQQAFTGHLVELSMAEDIDYPSVLTNCKETLRKSNHYFSASFTDILIITRPLSIQEPELIVHFESLPDDEKLSITRCYDLIVVFFRTLAECVEDELREYQFKEYVRTKSTYTWTGDKNELSETALALYLSGWIKRRDGRELKASVLARELAAFFGTDKLNFDQDINAMTYRAHGSRTEGTDHLQKKLDEYFLQKVENQD